ncbi:MAG TPA: class I SAM-dependent methyltransferase [Candidatus Polarisedimenticolia bacterium]|nr:class I SAM-dependent methyltransferase [Candidatus Polarisedimenticolia bacterium]
MGTTYAGAEHKAREIELHRHVAEGYRLRYGTPFAAIFQRFWNEELLALLPERIEAPALDNGCGTGILLPDLLSRCAAVSAVDLSPDMLAQARVRAPEADLEVGDLEDLPFADASFRTVICRGSLHHVPSREKAFSEAYRVLQPGGLFALTEPSDDFLPVRWARAALYRFSPKFDEHDRAFTRREVERRLAHAGFELLAFKRFGYLSYLFCGFPDVLSIILHLPGQVALTKALVRLDRLIARVPGVRAASFHLMALARKPPTTQF